VGAEVVDRGGSSGHHRSMSETSDLLPLFPLDLVLFPGTELPLHIFEPRYRRMIGDAMEAQSEFGVVTSQGKSLSPIGCTAIVEKVVQRHEDGRFDVLTRGVRRFRTKALDQEEAVLRARVEFFDDEPGPMLEADEVKALYELAIRAATLAGHRFDRPLKTDHLQPSFLAAAELPLDLAFKQRLLGLTSETQRVAELTAFLEAWIERQQTTDRARALSMRNGKGPH